MIENMIRRDQVDLVVSGREGKIFGSVGRNNNNKNISQIYICSLHAISIRLKQSQFFHFLHHVFHEYAPSNYSVWRVDD